MPHYMLTVHAPDGPSDETSTPTPPPDPDAMADHMARIEALEARMKDEGVWVASARLHDPATATVVRRDGDRTMLTDGPYLEAGEHVAGFYLIEATDLDDALAWAEQVVETIGMPALEVRPLAGYAA